MLLCWACTNKEPYNNTKKTPKHTDCSSSFSAKTVISLCRLLPSPHLPRHLISVSAHCADSISVSLVSVCEETLAGQSRHLLVWRRLNQARRNESRTPPRQRFVSVTCYFLPRCSRLCVCWDDSDVASYHRRPVPPRNVCCLCLLFASTALRCQSYFELTLYFAVSLKEKINLSLFLPLMSEIAAKDSWGAAKS